MAEVIEDNGIEKNIRYKHKITKASWNSQTSLWTVTATKLETGEELQFTTNFLWMCEYLSSLWLATVERIASGAGPLRAGRDRCGMEREAILLCFLPDAFPAGSHSSPGGDLRARGLPSPLSTPAFAHF